MALNGTDVMANGNILMETRPVVLYNDPLMFCVEDNQNDCTLFFKNFNNDVIPNSALQEFVLEQKNPYQTENEYFGNITMANSFNTKDELPFYTGQGQEVRHNSEIMQIFYKNAPKDQPEFIDVNNLTCSEHLESKDSVKASVVVSDEESDVIFVKEYYEECNKESSVPVTRNASKQDGIRRNPVRKARNIRGKINLGKEHILEEDFAFLDQTEEDNLIYLKKSSSSSSSPTYSTDNIKDWPINVYERPEFNPKTNKIEPFDFTIRNIQKSQEKKKNQIESPVTVKRKPKNKYFIRRRKQKGTKVEKKVSVKELKDVVNSTFDMVKQFFRMSLHNEDRTSTINIRAPTEVKDGIYNLLKNQTSLLSVINDFGEKEVKECVGKLLDGS